jgi:diguanylate cyclase (GGDEF)-like protein
MEELTSVLTTGDQHYLREGFIITEHGCYRGLGTGQALVKAVTEARIEAARYANPLTFLPGNILINQHLNRLLASGGEFVAAYADLNQFKAFNDYYGYWRGDEMIRLAADAIRAQCDPRRDFLGHIGGDDYLVVFQSEDWRSRCERITQDFNARALDLFDPDARTAGGIVTEDRSGALRHHACTTMSIGLAPVTRGTYAAAEDVAAAAAAAKRLAKQHQVAIYRLEPGSVVEATGPFSLAREG